MTRSVEGLLNSVFNFTISSAKPTFNVAFGFFVIYSSSRSIKRKRFDDEIVQYSLGIPPAQLNRSTARTRTTSQTLVAASPNTTASTPTTVAISSAAAPVNIPTPAIKSSEEISANFGTSIAAPHTPVTQKKLITPPNSVNRSVANLSTPPGKINTFN